MATRVENERKYKNWDDLADGRRRYWYDVPGRTAAGFARYIKVVDSTEATLSFVQEIYNGDGKLIAVHQKYPVDTGHQWLDEGN